MTSPLTVTVTPPTALPRPGLRGRLPLPGGREVRQGLRRRGGVLQPLRGQGRGVLHAEGGTAGVTFAWDCNM